MSIPSAPHIQRIDPPCWYAGMANPRLQLLVCGPNVAAISGVATRYPGAVVEQVVRLDSPNYLFVYLDLSDASPGVMTLLLDDREVRYTLHPRQPHSAERQTFDCSDVLYLLMPDRFAQGLHHQSQVPHMQPYREDRTKPDLRHGGDLEGIRLHLDYFTDLGVTTLWLTPVLENNAPDTADHFATYHGYAITDFYRVDPRLGTNDDYLRLVDEAHSRGLKVVMDMVFNHCGIDHPWVKDSPDKDWFNGQAGHLSVDHLAFMQTNYRLTSTVDPYASAVDRRETVEGWFVPTMPGLNQRNPHLMRYLIQNCIWWIETAGIDGLRMDTYPYTFAEPMAQCMEELQREYPYFNTVGETWVNEPAFTAAWQAGGRLTQHDTHLKTVMDFSFFEKLCQAKQEETDNWGEGLNRIYNSFVYDYLYADPSSVLAFIDNHDTYRFLGDGQDVPMLQQALALLLTVRRIPQLYYGTEVLMNGTKSPTDGSVRQDFPGGFPGDTHDCFTRRGRSLAQNRMYAWLRRLLHWRQHNDVIARGSQTQFIPHHGVYVIARRLTTAATAAQSSKVCTVLTVLNGTSAPAIMSVARYAEVIGNVKKAKNILTGRYVDLSADVPLKPRQTLVLEFSL